MTDSRYDAPYRSVTDLHPSKRDPGARVTPSDGEGDVDSESESDLSVELASTAASGSDNRLYLRLALYAGGNILTLALVLVLWTVWTLLSTFRNPMLWALLCSTALQDVKEDLVIFIKRKLASDRSAKTLFHHIHVCCFASKGQADCWSWLQKRGPDLPASCVVALWRRC